MCFCRTLFLYLSFRCFVIGFHILFGDFRALFCLFSRRACGFRDDCRIFERDEPSSGLVDLRLGCGSLGKSHVFLLRRCERTSIRGLQFRGQQQHQYQHQQQQQAVHASVDVTKTTTFILQTRTQQWTGILWHGQSAFPQIQAPCNRGTP